MISPDFSLVQDRLYATLANKELTKKMSPTNAKALNTMRQRLRKHNPQYAEQMEKFRANPESEKEPDRLTPHQCHTIPSPRRALSLQC